MNQQISRTFDIALSESTFVLLKDLYGPMGHNITIIHDFL